MIATIIISLLCVVAAYCVGRTVGLAKGFSNAFTMLERYEARKGGCNEETGIELFSDWLEYYLPRQTFTNDWRSVFDAWCEEKHPETTEGEREAVCDCFCDKPDAVCRWYIDPEDKSVNIVIKAKSKPSINNQNN